MRRLALVEDSPLRRTDPRVKLVLSLGASLCVMLPLPRLLAVMAAYVLLLTWARLLPVAGRQVWRLRWILILLFVLDTWLVGLDLALAVTLRLVLLAGALTLFFATTTPAELRLTLEWLHVPLRYAFSLTLAFQSLELMGQEWLTILEAQRSRGAWSPPKGWRDLPAQVRDWVALTVPTVVLTAKRAWTVTEAAYARGLDSPQRRPFRSLRASGRDWLLLVGSVALLAAVWLLGR